jgi:hypothetical protein
MAKLEPQFLPVEQLSDDDIAFFVAIGRQQALLMDDLQAALECGDDRRALGAARRLVNLEGQARAEQ